MKPKSAFPWILLLSAIGVAQASGADTGLTSMTGVLEPHGFVDFLRVDSAQTEIAGPLLDLSEEEKRWLDRILPQAVDWVEAQEASFVSVGRPLTEFEGELAGLVGVKHPERVRVVITDTFPDPTEQPLRDEKNTLGLGSQHYSGATLGYAILIKPRSETSELLTLHELVHVAQYERMGISSFVGRHLVELRRFGHARAPLETEAFRVAHEKMYLLKQRWNAR